MTERLSEQQNIDAGLYLAPFETRVFGGSHIEGDQLSPAIFSQSPSDVLVRQKAEEYRRNHSVINGTPAILEGSVMYLLYKRGINPQIRLHDLDETGHIDGVEIAFLRGDQQIIDLDEIGNITLSPTQRDTMVMERTDSGTVFIRLAETPSTSLK